MSTRDTAWPRADAAALARFDPATKRCTMNCGPSTADPRSEIERRFLCPECETVWPGTAMCGPAAGVKYTVHFPDEESYNLALNAARHMAEWAAIETAQASCDDPHSPYCNAMRERSDQYARVATIIEGCATMPRNTESQIIRRLRSLKALIGTDSPEVRGWAPAVQQEAQRVVNEAIELLMVIQSPKLKIALDDCLSMLNFLFNGQLQDVLGSVDHENMKRKVSDIENELAAIHAGENHG